MLIQIPFSGFYESIHSSNIDYYLDNDLFTDYATGCTNNDKLSNRAYYAIDFNAVYLEYAKEYSQAFADKFNITMQFESMTSPREYNFATDRIFCEISPSEIMRIYNATCKDTLARLARETFTSRDGFISFYEPDYLTWGDVLTWDYNQLNVLLDAYIINFYCNEDWEIYLMDDLQSNGLIDKLLYKHCTDKRIFKVHSYLQSRAERMAA